MKYIKKYENKLAYRLYKHFKKISDKKSKFKIGTYVLTSDGNMGQIGAVDLYNYWMVTNDVDDNDPYHEDEIVRELTPEEIKNYKIKKDSEKYNL